MESKIQRSTSGQIVSERRNDIDIEFSRGGEPQLPSPIARGHGRVAPDRGGWVQAFQVSSAHRSRIGWALFFSGGSQIRAICCRDV